MGWGLDVALGRAGARERGWPIGVVDATPVGHTLRPAGDAYPRERRSPRRARFLAGRPYVRRDEVRTLRGAPVKVAIVTEFYPRAHDPVLGVWAHRQARRRPRRGRRRARARPAPPDPARARRRRATLLARDRAGCSPSRAARRSTGSRSTTCRFLAPPRPRSYGSWGAWAAPPLARRACGGCAASFPFDLVHAHNAVPAGDAVRRARRRRAARRLRARRRRASTPPARYRGRAPRDRARRSPPRASCWPTAPGIERACRELGAPRTRVVRLGTDLPEPAARARHRPTADARDRRATSSRASATPTCCARCALLRDRVPDLRYW